MELTNAIPKEFLNSEASLAEKSATREAIEIILICLSPITPHLTHSLWEQLGNKVAIINVNWPDPNEDFLENLFF